MKNPVYNDIGKDYFRHRKADRRITQQIFKFLDLPEDSIIADIGAGTGNYSRSLADSGFKVMAVEPSTNMQKQSVAHARVEWVEAYAENIPISDNSVDAVVSILSSHHFVSLQQAIQEMNRICSFGPILWFTFDPSQVSTPWFAHYFPTIWNASFEKFPPLEQITQILEESTGRIVKNIVFSLPSDLTDHFIGAGWCRPEIYLDPDIRKSMSGFALADQTTIKEGIRELQSDIESGKWDQEYGYLREQRMIDWGYRFILASEKNTV